MPINPLKAFSILYLILTIPKQQYFSVFIYYVSYWWHVCDSAVSHYMFQIIVYSSSLVQINFLETVDPESPKDITR